MLFDVMITSGIQAPATMIRVIVHRLRATASVLLDASRAAELRALADLFERYPDEAVDYAAEWAAHFDKRMERAG